MSRKTHHFKLGEGWVFLVAIAIAGLLHISGPDVASWLRYDRDAIAAGELWRLFTGNLLHLNTPHLFMTVAGLLLTGFACRQTFSGPQWAAIMLAGMLGTGGGLYLLSPEIGWYVGMSGALHGVVLALIIALRSWQPPLVAGLAAIMVLKLGWEQWIGASKLTTALINGGPIVVDAHLYGAVAGGLTALLVDWWRRRSRKVAGL